MQKRSLSGNKAGERDGGKGLGGASSLEHLSNVLSILGGQVSAVQQGHFCHGFKDKEEKN